MRYYGEFANINDVKYSVTIITGGDSATEQEVQLMGESPCVISFQGDDQNIFKPVKYSSATIKLFLDDWCSDIYTSTAHGSQVIIRSLPDNLIKWTGYATPCLYDMDYNTPVYQLEVECIDGLSTLQYMDYQSEAKQTASILSIIRKLLSYAECYTYFYFSSEYQFIDDDDKTRMLTDLYVSEQNFFDEDGKAMKCDEVLEEICKYLGVTAVAYGNSVYFVNYNLIRAGAQTYHAYAIDSTSLSPVANVTRNHIKAIGIGDYSRDSGTISLSEVYTRATVTASLYSYDIAIVSPLDPNQMHIIAGVNDYSQMDDTVYKTSIEEFSQTTNRYILEDYHISDHVNYVFLENYASDFWSLYTGGVLQSYPQTKTWRACYTPGAHLVKVDAHETQDINEISSVDLSPAIILCSNNLQVSNQTLYSFGYYKSTSIGYQAYWGSPENQTITVGTYYMWPNSYEDKDIILPAGMQYSDIGEYTGWDTNQVNNCQSPDDQSMKFQPSRNGWASFGPVYAWPRVYVRELINAIYAHGITDYVSFFGSTNLLETNETYESIRTMSDE